MRGVLSYLFRGIGSRVDRIEQVVVRGWLCSSVILGLDRRHMGQADTVTLCGRIVLWRASIMYGIAGFGQGMIDLVS
jgi:hypothetical protein